MKKLLFEILDKIEPYDILEISTTRDYHIELCRADAVFPLACNLERISGFESLYRHEYESAIEAASFRLTSDEITVSTDNSSVRNNTISNYIQERNNIRNRYIEDHTIELNGLKFVIMTEILSIKYGEEHIEIQYSSREGKLTLYFLYSDIKSIRYRENGETVDDLKEYNAMQYSINKI